MHLIFRAGNILEAHIIAGLLQSRHIESHVGGHYLQGAVGDLPATDFAHVFVNEEDIELAEKIIAEYESGSL